MNIRFKDFLLPLAFTLVSVWIIQYVVMRYTHAQPASDKIVSGQSFVAPQTPQEVKLLNREIDFVDTQRSAEPVITKIDTKLGNYVFSTDGASIQEMVVKLERGNRTELISTIIPSADQEREDKCFLVALNQKTPYFYELVGHQESDESIVLNYQARTDEAVINKVFTVYKNSYKIDLQLTITPEKNEAIEARIFYPAPQAVIENDTSATLSQQALNMAAVMNDGSKVERISIDALDNQKGWYAPTLFGADNRYFIQVLVKDPQQFVKRAYYRFTGKNSLFSILEGPTIKERAMWNISFYFGPKQEEAMSAVDPRLEETLEYAGWLAIISKVLLKVLNFFYQYVGNYGLAIIIVTIIIKFILLPFTLAKPGSGKKNEEYQKKLAYIQQKYKDDPQRLTMEKAELVKKHGVPGAVAGCLPLLLQVPIFIGLSRVLSSSIELYRAPFGFWIKDLSARDPYYILPGLITICMVAQAVTAPSSQRLTILAMALIFGAIAANFAAGLALYLFVNTFLSVLQVIIQRKFKLG